MKNPNGYGSISKLSGKRRKPYLVRKTKGWSDNGKQIFEIIGCYETRTQAMNALANYNTNPYDIEKAKITFSELYEKWSEQHFFKVSDNAITNYKVAYKYCEPLYGLRFIDIRTNHMQSTIDNSGKAYPTRKLIKTLLNQLYNYAIENDISDKKYSQYLDIGKNEGKISRKPFTQEEIQILFDNEDKLDFIDTILIMIYTGLRVGELLSIKHDDVYLDKRYMTGGIKTQAGKNRVIPIHKKILPFVKKWYANNTEYLITNTKKLQMQYSNYRREKFDNIMEKLRMKHNPHDCRHTFASLMDSANANKLCIKRIMGHASQDITDKVYTHKDIDELLENVDLLE